MPFMCTDDKYRIYYEEYGDKDKPALLMIHGHGGSLEYFRKNIPALSERFHVVALDLRGHGNSDKHICHMNMERFARDVEKLSRVCGLKNMALLGWSMGASVACHYIRLFGCGNLSRLIIVDNTLKMIRSEDWPSAPMAGPKEAVEYMYDLSNGWEQYARKYVPVFFGEGACYSKEDFDFIMDSYVDNVNSAMMAQVVTNVGGTGYLDVPDQTDVPVLVTYGKLPSYYTRENMQAVADRFKDARLEGFEGGHIHFYQDADRFNEVLTDFILRGNQR